MDQVTITCVNPKGYSLTEGKEYSAVRNGNYYLVTNDNNANQRYYNNLFEEQQHVAEIVAEVIAVPPPPVYTYTTEVERENAQNFRIITLQDNVEINRVVLNSRSTQSQISCGVLEFSNLNENFSIIENLPNKTNFEKDAIAVLFLKNIVDCSNAAFVLFSTNTDGDEDAEQDKNYFYPRIQRCMSLAFENNLILDRTEYNPNSYNDITLWVVKKENH